MSNRRGLLLAPLVLLLGSAACTADEADPAPGANASSSGSDASGPVVQLGAPGKANTTLSPEEAEELADEVPKHTEADVAFVQGMLHHHMQALEMTAMVPTRAEDEDVRTLAERIEVTQQAEIEQLEAWLAARDEEPSGGHGDHGSHGSGEGTGHRPSHGAEPMPGLLTPEQLADLAAARGREFDRLFLSSMIYHHEGAVAMVETLLTQGAGGQEPQVFHLAQGIGADQQVEISRMKSMLS
jgi:uncharacterized protein (DUF305 family)